jgi:RimJ/RimL family protein N-acetyltransferase
MSVETKRLRLVAQTREDVRAVIEQMPPHERKEVSPVWLALLESSGPVDPWIHGFAVVDRDSDKVIGQCGFKGPPDAEGMVEISYGVKPEEEGKGYATEAAGALAGYALSQDRVRIVRAHTLPQPNASTRVLTKCGFRRVGEVVDPDDGLVWRWELESSEFRVSSSGLGSKG